MTGLDQAIELLLAGPRGRAVCLAISGQQPLTFLAPPGAGDEDDDAVVFFSAEDIHYDEAAVETFLRALTSLPLDELRLDDASVTDAVAGSVADAMYWQEPDSDDLLLADARVVEALRPFAEALAGSSATSWWGEPLDLADQHFVSWLFGKKQTKAEPPMLTGSAEARTRWRQLVHDEERDAARERPADHTARYSGNWWSTPVFSGLVTTTPRLPNGTPAQLVFVEDPEGMRRARVARLQPAPNVRILEISQPTDYVDLVATYPLPMDAARRHDWYRASGCRGPWLIPDWSAIGEHYDAIHLTVLGYLATAGRALPVGDHFTMLGGWDPSETWWLNDVLTQASAPRTWNDHKDRGWEPTIDPSRHTTSPSIGTTPRSID